MSKAVDYHKEQTPNVYKDMLANKEINENINVTKSFYEIPTEERNIYEERKLKYDKVLEIFDFIKCLLKNEYLSSPENEIKIFERDCKVFLKDEREYLD